jgi:hypothetical protein
MRDDLYEIMAEVADENRIDLESLAFDDTGDGLRLIIPLDLVQPTKLVDTFVAGLATGLREHRKHVSETARIRMRICVDLGVVEAHRRSWTGDVLVRAARLIDAQQVRDALDTNPDADLVAVVSDDIYKIIQHGLGHIPAECFQEIRVQVKEFDGPAWLLAPANACPYCVQRRRFARGGAG